MNIISKHKDYYDSIVGQTGIDKTIVFERFQQEVDYDISDKSGKVFFRNNVHFPSYGGTDGSYGHKPKIGAMSFRLFMVGFCGKIYIGAKVHTVVPHKFAFNDTALHVSYIYGIDNIKAAVSRYYGDDRYFNNRRDSALEYMLTFVNNKNMLETFYKYKTPQFILYSVEKENLIINGNLGEVQFYRVFDPYQALQEIQMYITGVLGVNNKPMIEISDKHKIVGHGFDPKYSFRKEPEKKR